MKNGKLVLDNELKMIIIKCVRKIKQEIEMKKLVSKDGKKVTYNGKSMKIYNALYAIYENERVNKVTINGRLVWFDNTGWQYDDTIPAAIKGQIVAKYEKDAKRLEL